jgi:probable DNA metabolism protein
MTSILLYDGSFDGLLCAIFASYERRLRKFEITKQHLHQPNLLDDPLIVVTDKEKSTRVWEALKRKLSIPRCNEIFKAFLSEVPEMEKLLSDYVRHVFSADSSVEKDLGHPAIIAISRLAKQVHREKHRMEAFVRFQRMKDDVYFATIEPDFNVLLLILFHFKDRYADQSWLIYDRRRKYGIFYESQSGKTSEVTFDFVANGQGEFLPESLCHEEELPYQRLWKEYFDSVNIASRKNSRLHVKHVPLRYWKYLTEKRL